MPLYEWQQEAKKQIMECPDCDFLVSAPTGAGKTQVAYLAMFHPIREGRENKIIYTVPTKALAREKYLELKRSYGKVGIATGDIKRDLRAQIIVAVMEIYSRMFVHHRGPARVIVDEFHTIFVNDGRSRAYIDGMANAPEEHKFVLMSATFGNVNRIKDYLLNITGRDFKTIITDFRPTRLEITNRRFSIYNIPPNSLVYVFNTYVISRIIRAVMMKRRMLSVYDIRRIRSLAATMGVDVSKFPEIFRGIAQYHSKLTFTERVFIEELVKMKYIDSIFSTTALGVGVNLPIEWVLFGSLKIPYGYGHAFRTISKIEFLQLAGRAGRPGYFDVGRVGLLTHDFLNYEKQDLLIEQYEHLIEKPMEDPVIRLHVDFEALLYGKPLEDEIEYCSRYSLPPIPIDKVITDVEKEELEMIQGLDEEIKEVLKIFWNPELTPHENFELVKYIKSLPEHKGIKNINLEELPITRTSKVEELLIKRRIGTRLQQIARDFGIPIKPRGFQRIEAKIRELDPLMIGGFDDGF